MIQTVERCPRCDKKHEGLKFKPVARPSAVYNYFTLCPDTKEPILAKVELTLVEVPDVQASRPGSERDSSQAATIPSGTSQGQN